MRIVTTNILVIALCTVLILFASTPLVLAEPPDNAALYYYQAFLLYEKPDTTMETMLSDFSEGKIQANEVIEQFIEKNRRVIDFVVKASDIPDCDWGYDYSQGWDIELPSLALLRRINYLIVAEAKLLAEKDDYKTALDRCLSVYKMALHTPDRPLVSHLVALTLNRRANECMQGILADTLEDLEMLDWLKDELLEIEKDFPSFKAAIDGESEMTVMEMRPEKIGKWFEDISASDRDRLENRIRASGEGFFERNRNYYRNYMADIIAAFDLPYPRTYVKLGELQEKMLQEVNENPDATLTALFMPALNRIYSIGVKEKTFFNAVRAAIELYLIKAKTGKLPDGLPAGLPKDLFSSKDFEYEKTADGFILRCQGKDLSNDEIYEYEFKVKK